MLWPSEGEPKKRVSATNLSLERGCSRDNFDQLCGDSRLSRSVVLKGQLADHLLSVLSSSIIHTYKHKEGY